MVFLVLILPCSHLYLLPPNVQNLLFKLAENERTAKDVASNVASNFDKLPPNVQNLLFKLAENERTAKDVASAVHYNFTKLPENIRNKLLIKLTDNEDAAYHVTYAC